MWGKRKLHFSCKLNMNAEWWRSILCVTVCQCLKKIIWNPLKEWQKIDGFFNPSFVLKENSSSKTDCFGVGHLSHDHVSQTNTPCDSGSSVVVPPNWQIANTDSLSVQGTSSKAHSCIGEMIGQTMSYDSLHLNKQKVSSLIIKYLACDWARWSKSFILINYLSG